MLNHAPDPKRTALLVYDMVNDFLLPGAPLESPRARDLLLPRLKPLIAACRNKKIRIIYACQNYDPDGVGDGFKPAHGGRGCLAGTPGAEVHAALAPQPGDIVLRKRRFDAFLGTDLDLILRQQRIDTLIIVGTSTSIGTETTALRGYTRLPRHLPQRRYCESRSARCRLGRRHNGRAVARGADRARSVLPRLSGRSARARDRGFSLIGPR